MKIITAREIRRLEDIFASLFSLREELTILYYKGTCYAVSPIHMEAALDKFDQHKSTIPLMQFAQFAFRLLNANAATSKGVIILIKNRLRFEDVRDRLALFGYEVEKDGAKTRVVEDY